MATIWTYCADCDHFELHVLLAKCRVCGSPNVSQEEEDEP